MEKHRILQVSIIFSIFGLANALLLMAGSYFLAAWVISFSIVYVVISSYVYWGEWKNYKEYMALEEFQAIKNVVVSDIKRFFLEYDDENVIKWGAYGGFAFDVMFERREICWIPQYYLVVDKFRISLPYYAEKDFIETMKRRMKELRRKKREKSPQRQEAESFVDELKAFDFMNVYKKKYQKNENRV